MNQNCLRNALEKRKILQYHLNFTYENYSQYSIRKNILDNFYTSLNQTFVVSREHGRKIIKYYKNKRRAFNKICLKDIIIIIIKSCW